MGDLLGDEQREKVSWKVWNPQRCRNGLPHEVLEMTSVELRAIGWVVTRDACWDLVRSIVGYGPRVSRIATRALGQRWKELEAVQSADSKSALITLYGPSSPMPADVSTAAIRLLRVLITACPALYSLPALHERCRKAWAHAIAGIAGGTMLGLLADPAYSLIGDAELILFIMGAWNTMTAYQLSCVRRLVAQVSSSE